MDEMKCIRCFAHIKNEVYVVLCHNNRTITVLLLEKLRSQVGGPMAPYSTPHTPVPGLAEISPS